MATFWRDLGKTSKDLLEKDFPTDAWGVEIEAKAPNDVKFKTTASRKADGTTAATFEPTLSFKEHGVELKGTFKTDKTLSGEVSLENKLVDGAKVSINGEQKGDKNTVKTTLDYKNKRFGTFSTAFSYPNKGNPFLVANATGSHEAFTAGGNVEYSLGSAAGVTAWNAKLLFKAPSYAFTLYANNKAGDDTVVGVNYLHAVRTDLDVVTDVQLDTSKPGEIPRFKLLTKWNRDAATTLKAKIDSESSRLTWSVAQKFSPDVSVVFGSEHSLAGAGAGSTRVAGTLKLNF
jgi:voltage-dependent anion channel protein 2